MEPRGMFFRLCFDFWTYTFFDYSYFYFPFIPSSLSLSFSIVIPKGIKHWTQKEFNFSYIQFKYQRHIITAPLRLLSV